MPLKLNKYLPSKEQITKYKLLKIFGSLLDAEYLWNFTKASGARGIAIGVFCAWIPLPFHTLVSIILAIFLRANIPLAAACVWLANPLTMPELYFTAYKIGSVLLHTEPTHLLTHFTVKEMATTLEKIWQPFLLGCLVCGLVSALLSYLCAKVFWSKTT